MTTLIQPISANDPGDWKSFQIHAQERFCRVWDVELRERPVLVAGKVAWKFDLVSLTNASSATPSGSRTFRCQRRSGRRSLSASGCSRRLQAERVFMVFGREATVAKRWLTRMREFTIPVEFYYLDGAHHRRI